VVQKLDLVTAFKVSDNHPLDRGIALLMLLKLALVFLVIGLVIELTSPGPVLRTRTKIYGACY
jgi:lipopolysaccharide/colanic/teichoic acid biosynthesis glycosyltransferase